MFDNVTVSSDLCETHKALPSYEKWQLVVTFASDCPNFPVWLIAVIVVLVIAVFILVGTTIYVKLFYKKTPKTKDASW